MNMKKCFWLVLSFEHINFAINGECFKKLYDNPYYYASLVNFHTYKNKVLKSVHSLEWLLWLCFYSYIQNIPNDQVVDELMKTLVQKWQKNLNILEIAP
jgi:hypothetical protein